MNVEQLVNAGNQLREENQPLQALAHYAQAFIIDPDNFSAWNNYGNVLRECGRPDRAVAFLQNALAIAPDQPTANFNLAVAYLLMGDYERGWPQYESRWRFEHLNGLFCSLAWLPDSISSSVFMNLFNYYANLVIISFLSKYLSTQYGVLCGRLNPTA